MTKKQARELLSKLWPYVQSSKQRLALFTAVLLLALAPMDYDAVHLHVESAPSAPSVSVSQSGSGTLTTKTFSSLFWDF